MGGVGGAARVGRGHRGSMTRARAWPHHEHCLARIIRLISAGPLSVPSNYPPGLISSAEEATVTYWGPVTSK